MDGDELDDDTKRALAEHQRAEQALRRAVRDMSAATCEFELAERDLRWAKIGVNVAKQRLEAL